MLSQQLFFRTLIRLYRYVPLTLVNNISVKLFSL